MYIKDEEGIPVVINYYATKFKATVQDAQTGDLLDSSQLASGNKLSTLHTECRGSSYRYDHETSTWKPW